MIIADLLRHKGPAVVTIGPDAPVTELLAQLAEHRIGTVVVVDGAQIMGIASERDVVRRLYSHGSDALTSSVGELMTASVISCAPGDPIDAVAAAMTDNRIRHMPVVTGTELVGIVTIGDVVASRLRNLEQERSQLESYITQG
jgi:CBS domain-containing protein